MEWHEVFRGVAEEEVPPEMLAEEQPFLREDANLLNASRFVKLKRAIAETDGEKMVGQQEPLNRAAKFIKAGAHGQDGRRCELKLDIVDSGRINQRRFLQFQVQNA